VYWTLLLSGTFMDLIGRLVRLTWKIFLLAAAIAAGAYLAYHAR